MKHSQDCLKQWLASEKTPKRISIKTYEPDPISLEDLKEEN